MAKKKQQRKPRRAAHELRGEVLNNGGHLVIVRLPATEDSLHDGSLLTKWKTIEAKGFFVLNTGCLVPHAYYSKKGLDGPSRARGHIVANDLFVDKDKLRGTGQKDRNDDGWPLLMEVSHICHNPRCCAPWHLVTETRWSNWRRNYCSGCDCPPTIIPRCVCKFHPTDWWNTEDNWSQMLIKQPVAALAVIKEAMATAATADGRLYDVKLLPKTFFTTEDQKAINRNTRRDRKRKHDKQKMVNDARKESDVGSDDSTNKKQRIV